MRKLLHFAAVWAFILSASAQQGVYETLESSYRPYMNEEDTLAWPMKVQSISSDPYKFWRGSKDLFFIWCKTHTADWFADPDKFVLGHGDVHLGNVGSYARSGTFGNLAFGLVDFDDSARMPYQIDLLQAYISMRLAAQVQKIELSNDDREKLAQVLSDQYAAAMTQTKTATELLGGNKFVRKLLDSRGVYDAELQYYVADGRFKPQIMKKEKIVEILRPADERADEFAAAIAATLARDGDLRAQFRYSSARDIRDAMQAVAQRTRMGSSGSQGLKKYFILMRSPLKGIDHDVILYLKQQIPAAAERTKVVPVDPRSPGRRICEHLRRFNDPPMFLNGWCDVGGESYWLTIKEPWSDELDPAVVKNVGDLLEISQVFGAALGAARSFDSQQSGAKLRVDLKQLPDEVRSRGDAFVDQVNADYAQFIAHPSTQQLLVKAKDAMTAAR